MTHNELRQHFDREIESFGRKLFSFPWENESFYANWLAQTYYFALNSTRMLSLAAGEATLDEQELHRRFVAHVSEEINHEIMAVRDLGNLGFDVSKMQESRATKDFYGHQFNVIREHGPSAFMGWVLFLEGISAIHGPRLLTEVSPFGPDATLFLKVHAEDDQDHIDSAFDVVNLVPEAKLDLVLQNMLKSSSGYEAILEFAKTACRNPTAAA